MVEGSVIICTQHAAGGLGGLRLAVQRAVDEDVSLRLVCASGTLKITKKRASINKFVFAAVVDLQSSTLQMGRYEVTTQSHVEDETCVTCLEQFKDGELRSKLDCGYRLHRRCLDGMIINVIDRCPFCRSYL